MYSTSFYFVRDRQFRKYTKKTINYYSLDSMAYFEGHKLVRIISCTPWVDRVPDLV